MSYKITNVTRGGVLADKAELADSFFVRMKGLLGRDVLRDGCGLIIRPGGCVHTLFMRFPVDIVFLAKAGRAIKVRANVPPFRFVFAPLATRVVLELPAGKAFSANTCAGDRIDISRE